MEQAKYVPLPPLHKIIRTLLYIMKIKTGLFLIAGLFAALPGMAQKKNFTYKFYGQVRGFLFYNSRANTENVDGLFHLYPKDISPDADGNDLNATTNSSFYMLYSRLGINVSGPRVGNAATTACLEADFRGSGSNFAILRMRQAWVGLDWGKSALLIGQTWHPLYGDVTPQMLNLSTGAPFQSFGRCPMVRYRYTNGKWCLTAAALWQLQYLSTGPAGKSEEYMKHSGVPEFYAGVDFRPQNWTIGMGAEVLSIVPRIKSEVEGKTYKVHERVTSASIEAHARYEAKDWKVSMRTMLASNMAHLSMLGGYGVTGVDSRTGKQSYSPYRYSTTWVNIVYGHRWQPGVFVGYLKNLGAGSDIVGPTYGIGLDVDRLVTTNVQLSYVLPHWKVGVEYSPSVAWYADATLPDGRASSSHSVTNHRLLAAVMYMF